MSEADRARLPLDGIKPVEGLSGDEDIPRIASELRKRGYGATQIDLIMGENFVRVFSDVLKP